MTVDWSMIYYQLRRVYYKEVSCSELSLSLLQYERRDSVLEMMQSQVVMVVGLKLVSACIYLEQYGYFCFILFVVIVWGIWIG